MDGVQFTLESQQEEKRGAKLKVHLCGEHEIDHFTFTSLPLKVFFRKDFQRNIQKLSREKIIEQKYLLPHISRLIEKICLQLLEFVCKM